MRKHLNRKHKCLRIIDSYNYKEEKIEELSLTNRNELIIIKSNDFVSEDNIVDEDNIIESSIIDTNIIDTNIIDTNIIDNSLIKQISQKLNETLLNNEICTQIPCNPIISPISSPHISNNKINNINSIKEHIIYIKNNNIVDCIYCKKKFYRKYELIRHIENICPKYVNEENKKKNKEEENISNINYINNISNNNQINNQQINNISINVYNNDCIKNNKILITPFDKEWDMSNIDHQKKLLLFLSDNKYTNTMEEILKNDKNKNVLFDDNNDCGLVFQDDKFINMASDEIIIKMMCKLYNHLQTFYDEIKNNNYINCDLNKHKDTLEEKYIDFNKDNITKEVVKNILVDIFHNNKEKIIKQFLEFNKYLTTDDKNKVGF
jgi:hypothetical protein